MREMARSARRRDLIFPLSPSHLPVTAPASEGAKISFNNKIPGAIRGFIYVCRLCVKRCSPQECRILGIRLLGKIGKLAADEPLTFLG